jgi:UDP-N-acetylmuramate dehydrogenase
MTALAFTPDIGTRVLRNEPMSRHTSWRVGGPADLFFEPTDVADLQEFLRQLDEQTPVMCVGLGSNLLVRDGGIRGAVISTHGHFDDLNKLDDTHVLAGAGVHCARLAKQCVKWGIGPAEFFSGIPGTIGGALAMNAGAFGGETWTHVEEVDTIDRRGELHHRAADEYLVGYRSVQGPVGEWFVAARLRFESRPAANNDEVRALLTRRKETQPVGALSCGSVFTNPPGDYAARLIEAAGLKGYRIGGACVSEKHANFILNEDNASGADLEQLIAHVQTIVAQKSGVELHTEVRIVGEAK